MCMLIKKVIERMNRGIFEDGESLPKVSISDIEFGMLRLGKTVRR